MKTTYTLAFLSSLIPVACGQVPTSTDATQALAAYSSSDEGANELFLDDLTEASASTDAVDTAEAASDDVDDSVKKDIEPGRLQQMAERLFAELDEDSSGGLSLEEFLVGPEKRAEDKNLPDEAKAKLTEKVTADFTKYAGTDSALSIDELKTLLKEVAPRIGHHRAKKHKGEHEGRVKQSWADITAKYDTNKDGQLSQTEFEAMKAHHKSKHKEMRQKIRFLTPR
jgi:Ca2+-binding EF-hand superfamily protein